MANKEGVLIESISEQAFKSVERFVKLLESGIDTAEMLETKLKKVSLPSGVAKAAKDVETNIRNVKNASSDYEKQVRSLQNAEKKRMQVTSTVNKQTQKLRVETNKINRETRLQAKYNSMLSSVYDKLDAKLSILSNEYRNLAIRKELGVKITEKEAQRMDFLEQKIQKYYGALVKVDGKIGKFGRNVGNYKSGFDGLGFSVAQLTREMPAFANSAQTGFMAISNNIPMLVDEINKLRGVNKALAAEGKPTKSVLKSLGAAMFSWHTLISVGVTIMTVYGKEIIDMAFGLSKAEKQQRKYNEAISEGNAQAANSSQNLRTLKSIVTDVTVSEAARRAALVELKNTVVELKDVELDHAGALETIVRLTDSYIKATEARAKADAFATLAAETEAEMIKRKAKGFEDELAWYDYITEAVKNFGNAQVMGAAMTTKAVKKRTEGLAQDEKFLAMLNDKQREYLILAMELEDGLEGFNKKTKENMNIIKGSVEWYGKLIKKIEELRDNTATTGEQYEAFERQITSLRREMQMLTGEYDAYLQALKEGAKLQSSDEALKSIEGNTDAIERENEKLQEQEVLRIKREQRMQKEREMLKASLVEIGNTLGIQEQTVSDLFDSFAHGFIDAGEAAQQFGALFNDVIAGMARAENARIDERIQNLQREKEIAIAFAGDSAEARGEIEERYRKRERELQNQKLKNEKQAAIFQSIINTATAVIKALADGGIPLSIAVGILGAANTAIIASAKVPQFKDGVRGFKGGNAILGDGGKQEPYTDGKGRLIGVSPAFPTLVDLPPGANVYKDFDSFNNELNRTLGANDINPLGSSVYGNTPKVNVNSSSVFSEEGMERVLRKTLGSMPQNVTNIDKNGIKTFVQNGINRTELMNNRVSMKGKSV